MHPRDAYPAGSRAWTGQGDLAGLLLDPGIFKGRQFGGGPYVYLSIADTDGNPWLLLVANPDGSSAYNPSDWVDGKRDERLVQDWIGLQVEALSGLGLLPDESDPRNRDLERTRVYLRGHEFHPQRSADDATCDDGTVLTVTGATPLPRDPDGRARDPRGVPFIEGVQFDLPLTGAADPWRCVAIACPWTRTAVLVGFADQPAAKARWDDAFWSTLFWEWLDSTLVVIGAVITVFTWGIGAAPGGALIAYGLQDAIRRWYAFGTELETRDREIAAVLKKASDLGHTLGGGQFGAGAGGAVAAAAGGGWKPSQVGLPIAFARTGSRASTAVSDAYREAAAQVDAATLQKIKDSAHQPPQDAAKPGGALLLGAAAVVAYLVLR